MSLFYAVFNLRNLLYIIDIHLCILYDLLSVCYTPEYKPKPDS